MSATPDLPLLFHRLNNQLSVVLANAELLEGKAVDPAQRARAGQVVASALDDIEDPDTFRPLQTTRSDPSGSFSYAGVPPGLYLLTGQ